MKYSLMLLMFALTGCASMMPDVAKIVDDMTDTSIRIDVSKEVCDMKDADVECTVRITQKDPVVAK